MGKDNANKWDKMADLRVLLGEMMLNCLKSKKILQDSSAAFEKLNTFLKEWDSSNVFGGPTLVNQLKRELSAGVPTASPSKTEETPKQHKPVTAEAQQPAE